MDGRQQPNMTRMRLRMMKIKFHIILMLTAFQDDLTVVYKQTTAASPVGKVETDHQKVEMELPVEQRVESHPNLHHLTLN